MLYDIYTVWLREMLRFVRARSRIVSSLAMPFFWLILLGFGFSPAISIPGINYTSFLAPGVIGMIILFTSIFSGVSIIYDRQFGFLKEILVTPVSRTSIVLGKTFGGATVAIINALIMLGVSSALGFLTVSITMLLAIPFMILSAVCFVAIGILLASKMKSMEGFQMLMSFLIMPVFFLSGALFPLSNAPEAMKIVSYADPLTYGVDGLRDSLLGSGGLGLTTDFLVLLGFSAAFVLIGSLLFRKSVQV